jgi:hypothetical protein
MQFRTKADTKEPIFGQQKLEHTRRLEALTPGWWMLWRDKTAAALKRAGKSGLKTPVETSPKTSTAPTFLETTDKEGEASIACTSGQEGWAKESSWKSMGRASAVTGEPAVAGVELDNNTAGGGSGGPDGGGIDRTGKPFVAGVRLDNNTAGGGLERASATTFSEPGVCLRSVVNSEMYARCRCWRADCGGVTRTMAATSGL